MENKKVITRFAPSPTGKFHVGGIRSALYNYLFARKNNGKFILRCDDTDDARSKKEYEDYFLDVFKWLGLEYDEYFRQSDRKEIYKKYLEKLISEDKIYLSKEEIKEEGDREEVIRFRNPNKIITFSDVVLGDISFDTKELGDFIIARDLESPLYHFTSVIDDFEMGVTHIIRGQEHVSNTPRQILIQEAIGAQRPIYAHGSIILNEKREKLSKRDPFVKPVLEYKELGYLSNGLINFISFLGWNPGGEDEIFTLKELIEKFSLDRMQKSGAVFNPEKLEWFNKEHMKKMDFKEQEINALVFVPNEFKTDSKKIQKIIPLLIDRISYFGEIKEIFERGEMDFFFKIPDIDLNKISYKDTPLEKTKENLKKVILELKNIPEDLFTKDNIKEKLMVLADSLENRGSLLHPLRFTLSGLDKSPDPFIIASILGKDETISRLQKVA